MKKILVVLFVAISMIVSCKKDLSYCENHQVGDLRVVNNEADAFTFYLDGALLGTIPAHSSATYRNKRSNTYAFKAVQAENGGNTPYVSSFTVVIVECETTVATVQ